MDAETPIRCLCYRTTTNDGQPAAGVYVFADVSDGQPLRAAFDAVARRMIRADREDTGALADEQVVWAVVAFGFERADTGRIKQAQDEYDAMWDRVPELWDRLQRYSTVFSLWLVDSQLRPVYLWGRHSVEASRLMVLVAEDVRDEEPYRALRATPTLHAQRTAMAVAPEMLSGAWAALKTPKPAEPGAASDPPA